MMIRKTLILLTAGILMPMLFCLHAVAQDVDKLEYPKLNEIKIPDVEKVTLDNGMRLYLLEDKSLPVFNVSVRVNCGTYLDPAEKIGMGDLCGMVMRTGGTEKWTGDEIDELLEGIGATVETYVNRASGGAYVNVLSEYADTGLAVLAEVLRRPVFDEDKIEVAKMQHRSGIARRNDQIAQIARREYNKLIYGADSPFARHTEYATIEAISRQDLINYHTAYFHPENIMMAIWGDFKKKDVIKKIKKLFGEWERGGIPVPPLPRVDYDFRSKVYYIEKTDVEQAYIRLGHIGGLTTDPDYADRIVMNSILGEGFGSRITDAVRTKLGLAYSTGGRYTSNISYPGYFYATASTKPQSALLATREMIKQIKSMLTDLPTEKEMKKGKDGYLNSFVFNFDTRREVLERIMAYDFYGLPEDFLQQEKEKVENVTPEAVMAAAKNNLRPDEMVVLVVGNGAEFEQPLDSLGLGPVDTIDISIPPAVEEEQVEVSEGAVEKGMALLNKAVDVAGGLENFKKIQTVSFKSNILVESGQHRFEVAHEAAMAYPDKKRNVVFMAGVPIYDIYDGETGWKTGGDGEIRAMDENEIAEAGRDLSRNIISIFRQADNLPYQVVYAGPDVIDDIAVEYVALMEDEENSLCRLGIDADGRLVCCSFYGITAFGPGITEEVFSAETEIEGVKIPMQIKRIMNGQEFGVETISEFLINPELSTDTFAKPSE